MLWDIIALPLGIIIGAAVMFLVFGKNYKKFQWAYDVLQNHADKVQQQYQDLSPRISEIERRIDAIISAIRKELEDLRANRG